MSFFDCIRITTDKLEIHGINLNESLIDKSANLAVKLHKNFYRKRRREPNCLATFKFKNNEYMIWSYNSGSCPNKFKCKLFNDILYDDIIFLRSNGEKITLNEYHMWANENVFKIIINNDIDDEDNEEEMQNADFENSLIIHDLNPHDTLSTDNLIKSVVNDNLKAAKAAAIAAEVDEISPKKVIIKRAKRPVKRIIDRFMSMELIEEPYHYVSSQFINDN